MNGKRIAKSDMDTETYRNYDVLYVEMESSALLIELKPFDSLTPER